MQNLISLGGVPKIPPSELGFVCKPEMPPHINILFRARPPLPFIPFNHKGLTRKYSGIFPEAPDILNRFESCSPLLAEVNETKQIIKLKTLAEKLERQKEINKDKLKEWDPKSNANATKDPYKTLFVYKLDPKIDEKKLKKEFEVYGEIRHVRIIKDFNMKSRGYGFIEFRHSSHFKNAERFGKKKIRNNVIFIDYERGRTEKGWKPRRLGGGKGDSRSMPKWLEMQLEDIKKKYPELIAEKGEINENELLLSQKRKRNEDEDDATIKEENSSYISDENKRSKKEFEVGEIV